MTDAKRNELLAFRAGYVAGKKDREEKVQSSRDAENHLRALDLPTDSGCVEVWLNGYEDGRKGDSYRYERSFKPGNVQVDPTGLAPNGTGRF